MSVALGMANLALCTDMSGEARVAAACSGLYCYRSSASLGGGSAASSPGSVEALSVMGVDLPQLLQAAEALGAPGGAGDARRVQRPCAAWGGMGPMMG